MKRTSSETSEHPTSVDVWLKAAHLWKREQPSQRVPQPTTNDYHHHDHRPTVIMETSDDNADEGRQDDTTINDILLEHPGTETSEVPRVSALFHKKTTENQGNSRCPKHQGHPNNEGNPQKTKERKHRALCTSSTVG